MRPLERFQPTDPVGSCEGSIRGNERLRADALPGRVEHVLQDPAQLLGAPPLRLAQVGLGVLHRLLEHEQAVPERLELLTGDDQLMLTEPELDRAPARFVVALAARVTAVHTRPPGPGRNCERAAAPAAGTLRHSDK